MAITYEPIASTTLSSATNLITFSSIPQTYTDLRIVWVFKSVSSGNYPFLRFNNVIESTFSYTTLYGTGSAAGSQKSSNNNGAYLVSYAAASTTDWQMETIDIFSYTSSNYKTILNRYSGSSNFVSAGVNLWRNTSAITSINIQFDSEGNMPVGTTATLFGIKAA